jgi:photosystem II stability/assembly factor-like uncharacterized protein
MQIGLFKGIASFLSASLISITLTGCGSGGGGGGGVALKSGTINPTLFSGWEMTNGPFSGSMPLLTVDPIDSEVLYSITRKSEIYGSEDGGSTWEYFPTVESGTQEDIWVRQFEIAPADNRVFYLGTSSQGIYKSTDGGDTWVHISNGLPSDQYGYLAVDQILIDPTDSETVYVRLDLGYRIYKTINGGQNWFEIYNGTSSLNPATDMVVDPTDTQILYIGLWYQGVWKSTDGGLNWMSKNNGLPRDLQGNIPITELAIDHQSSLRIYAGTFDYGLYGTGNGGDSWVYLEIFPERDYQEILSLEVDPNDGLAIYVGMNDRDDSSKDGLWVTNDGGLNWTQYFQNTRIGFIRIAPNDSTAFVNAEGDVYGRSNPTKPWRSVSFDMVADIRVNAFSTILPSDRGFLYAGTELGVYKTTNGGNTWELKNQGLGDEYIYALLMDPNDRRRVHVGTLNGVYVTTDGGEHWEERNNGLANRIVYGLAMDPTNSDVLYAGTDRGIFQSTDAGANWVEKSSGLPFTYNCVWHLAVAPTDQAIVYASVLDFLGTWQERIYKSTDGGDSWMAASGQLPSDKTIRDITISPVNPDVVYVGIEGHGVYTTEDGGGTWEGKKSGLASLNVKCVSISRGNSEIVYAGTADEGVFATIDGGDSWQQLDEGLPTTLSRNINTMVISPDDKIGYAGTCCAVFKASR